MGLPKGNDPDSARGYLNGTISGGGLWRALEILDDALLQASTNTLDNVILTGQPQITDFTRAQHTHASAAQAGSTLGPGVTLSSPAFAGVVSTGAQFSGNLGVGVAPAAWHTSRPALQVGSTAALWGGAGAEMLELSSNEYRNASNQPIALVTGPAAELALGGGGMTLSTAPSVAAGAAQTFTARLTVNASGTVTVTPAAGQAALVVASGTTAALQSPGNLFVDPGSNFFVPRGDGAVNNGSSGNKWAAVYATAGTINTSLAEMKDNVTPLDPAAALEAVRNTTPVTFDYKAPPRGPGYYELPDDPEQAHLMLLQRMRAAPLEEGARHQAGFVLSDPSGQYHTDPLFETGSGQSNSANSVGVLIAALHEIDRRLSALEAPARRQRRR